MSKELLQQALDALLGYKPQSLTHAKEQEAAVTALRAAIAQAEPLSDEQIEAGASALVGSCISKGHWAHATDESTVACQVLILLFSFAPMLFLEIKRLIS